MKKLFMLAAVAMMVCGTAAAQTSDKVADATKTTTVDYSFKVNNNALSRFLKLNSDQADKMDYVCARFDADLQKVRYCKPEKRAKFFMKALSYNLSAAHQVLDKVQYHKYLNTLNRTMSKNGLDKVYVEARLAMAN